MSKLSFSHSQSSNLVSPLNVGYTIHTRAKKVKARRPAGLNFFCDRVYTLRITWIMLQTEPRLKTPRQHLKPFSWCQRRSQRHRQQYNLSYTHNLRETSPLCTLYCALPSIHFKIISQVIMPNTHLIYKVRYMWSCVDVVTSSPSAYVKFHTNLIAIVVSLKTTKSTHEVHL